MEEQKRKISPALKKLLDIDATATKHFVLWLNQYLPFRSLRIHYKMLEISCHGVPWFAFWIAFTWLFNNSSLVQLQVNMLLGLLLDVVIIAVIKAYVRRRRPIPNTDDKLGQLGPDKFSFPSGHASRSIFVVFFFLYLYPLPRFFMPPFLAWSNCVCLSRVLLNRHYILDVVAGIALGVIEGLLLGFLWLSDDTSKFLMSFLSDEKLDGGEYHV